MGGGGLEVWRFGGRGQVFTGDSAETLTMTAESHPLFKSHGRKSFVRFMHSPFNFQTLSIPHWVDVCDVIRTFDVSEQNSKDFSTFTKQLCLYLIKTTSQVTK